jgi:hypothetical protein
MVLIHARQQYSVEVSMKRGSPLDWVLSTLLMIIVVLGVYGILWFEKSIGVDLVGVALLSVAALMVLLLISQWVSRVRKRKGWDDEQQ